ncbi:hypothetical protein JX266_001089 [Neoarthrinium moseri]|nr:hypothetical protein JX266_001089 [Neoarthrinium moseri]
MTMESLPHEILLQLCSLLDPADARRLRLASRKLSQIAAERGFVEINFYLHQPHFANLRALARHPTLHKYVKTLVFIDDTMGEDSSGLDFGTCQAKTLAQHKHPSVERFEKNWLCYETPSSKHIEDCNSLEIPHSTAHEVETRQLKYKKTVYRRQELVESGDDFSTMFEVLPKFTCLDGFEIRSERHVRDRLRTKSPFDSSFHRGTRAMEYSAHNLLFAVLNTLDGCDLRIELDSLVIRPMKTSALNESTLISIGTAFSNLESIDLIFDSREERLANVVGSEPLQPVKTGTKTGALAQILRDMPELRSVSIQFTGDSTLCWQAEFKDIFKDGNIWKHLESVRLERVTATRWHFQQFFASHKGTLRSISLGNSRLEESSWIKLLKHMKAELQLRDLRLWGRLQGSVEDNEDYEMSLVNNNEHWNLGRPESERDVGPCLATELEAWYFNKKSFPTMMPLNLMERQGGGLEYELVPSSLFDGPCAVLD